ncbi:hypothetical protein [Pseudonocardia lacus]|uniref:hypothetical protein n=1 Tax=Pseudonocardia lacus TaxID=2835865 RepID=UPI001BDC201A|nr:hypothetical protein [Pseudonocardia lacus]
MSVRETRRGHPAAVLGTGLGAVLAGVALLLQAYDALPIGWDVVLPVLLVVVGVVTATAGVVGAHRSRPR